jgi:superfamily I DNA and/or RNA helicase
MRPFPKFDAASDIRRLGLLRLDQGRASQLLAARFVCTTVHKCVHPAIAHPEAGEVEYPWVLVEEAAQLIEPAVLVALERGCQQLVMIGDWLQLPPTVADLAKGTVLDVSMMQRLVQELRLPKITLDTQQRMHPTISDFPRIEIYEKCFIDGDRVQNKSLVEGIPWLGKHPVLVITLSQAGKRIEDHEEIEEMVVVPSGDGRGAKGEDKGDGRDQSTVRTSPGNMCEAFIVEAAVASLLAHGVKLSEIGVIAPYAGQVELVKSLRDTQGWAEQVMSIDGAQGGPVSRGHSHLGSERVASWAYRR